MKKDCYWLVASLGLFVASVNAFQQLNRNISPIGQQRRLILDLVLEDAPKTGITGIRLQRYGTSPLLRASSNNNDDESLSPMTAFGAEVVPEGQRPVNEYLDMKRAPLFDWASEERGTQGLLTRLAILYTVVFAVVGYPIAGATFTQDGYLLQKLAASNVGSLGVILAVLIRLYSGWGYVGTRLQSKVIEYEETGWYDGSFEPKTEAELKRDRFLYQSEVKPSVDRLKVVTLSAVALFVAACIGLNAAVSIKPVFDQYDPAMLERLRYDDKVAGLAADKSAGRPTYCDNRYYRAVANGGQGCN